MGNETQAIDMLFLELSQFTTATTKKELELRELAGELLEYLKDAQTRTHTYRMGTNELISKAEKILKGL